MYLLYCSNNFWSSKLCGWTCSLWPSWVREIHAKLSKSRLEYSIRFCGSNFSKLKQNFIGYRSSKVSSRPDCIFEIHQQWQAGFSKVYSNYLCSSLFEPEILKMGQWSHKVYSNNLVNFQESTTILNACTKKSENLLKAPSEKFLVVSWKTELNPVNLELGTIPTRTI